MKRDPIAFMKEEYEALVDKSLDWQLRNLEGPSKPRSMVDGKEVIMFCSNNYLGLSNHPKMKKAMIEATEKYGVGSGSVRPIAGNLDVGLRLVDALVPIVSKKRDETSVIGSIRRMRSKALQAMGSHADEDVKVGIGGIRDIEFLVQGLQLLHLHRTSELFSGNTVDALSRLKRHGLVSRGTARTLSKDYLFLRRVEHYLQILEDRQTHLLPKKRGELKALAKRLFGPSADEAALKDKLTAARDRTQRAFDKFITAGILI